MGAPYIDYIIADQIVIPEQSQQYYVEKVVYLPTSYQPNDRKGPISDKEYSRAELGLPPDGFVFCCFNNTYKITPEVFDSWMRILRQVNGSVLWLLQDDEAATRNLRMRARARDVDDVRLIFSPRTSLAEHLARQRAADLFIDTMPYNAHTTASDALWVGLPVLTRSGQSFAARVAASLLNAVGLPELVAPSSEQYEQMAIALATDTCGLARIRNKLQRNRLTAPLFDAELLTRCLERAYEQIYARYQQGLAPERIDVK
jgi:predicted O-linked N-acetylglucosamine transferase (SPINDLY family)